MNTLLYLILGQCVFAVGAIVVLVKLLDKELMNAALEQFEICKIPPDIKEITVRSASTINAEFKNHLEFIRQRKFAHAHLNFQEDVALKGGIVIAVGDILLDFSLAHRLQHFWS